MGTYLKRIAPNRSAKRRSSETVSSMKPAADARAQAVARSCLTAASRTSMALSSSFLQTKTIETPLE